MFCAAAGFTGPTNTQGGSQNRGSSNSPVIELVTPPGARIEQDPVDGDGASMLPPAAEPSLGLGVGGDAAPARIGPTCAEALPQAALPQASVSRVENLEESTARQEGSGVAVGVGRGAASGAALASLGSGAARAAMLLDEHRKKSDVTRKRMHKVRALAYGCLGNGRKVNKSIYVCILCRVV